MSFRRMRHVKAREFQGCDLAYDFSNPANLYDATSGGSLVAADGGIARSNDVSGGSGHMIQATGANQPLRKVAAINGLDVARFDGSSDYLSAGDVGDMLANPVEAYAVFQRTGSAAFQGFFGKSMYGAANGRWALWRDSGNDFATAEAGTNSGPANNAPSSSVSTLQVLGLVLNRSESTNGSLLTQRRNGSQAAIGSAYTGNLTSYDTAHITLIGAYQDGSGTGVQAASYFSGDMGECCKFSVYFGSAQRRRFELSRCRKWRIAS